MTRTSFFKTFLEDVKVGAITPTSPFGVRNVCKKVDPEKARVVVEYGPGTGVFTKFLLDILPDTSKLILIETNQKFCEMLENIDDPRVHVYNDSAENIKGILEDCGESAADCVISGIPFSLLGEEMRRNVLENTRNALSEEGKFLVYQYSAYMKKHLREHFENVALNVAVLNVPPLFIFEASD